ncbi:MAG: hypothetical protein Kow0089_23360 [Desulfobulbaceae bacterium]
MFEKIFVAMEMDPAAHEIISCLGGLKPLGARKAFLAHYLNVSEAIAASFEVAVDQLREGLAALKTELEEQGFEVEAQVAVASTHGEVNRLILAKDASLVVVGAPPGSLGHELLYGGVATTILHNQVRPVLAYRMCGDASPCKGKACDFFSHILFPTDFSDNADRAFRVLEKIVEKGVGRVTLAHVQDLGIGEMYLQEKVQELAEIDRDRLEGLKARLTAKHNVQVETVVRSGIPGAELLQLERELQPSMVLMGSQGRGYFSEIFLGSVSHTMARKGSSHLLLIPAREQ